MSTQKTDILILGAGCAGLSLACHLAELRSKRSVLIVDSKQSFADDRTWCRFDTGAHLFSDCVSHRWDNWTVRDAKNTVTHKSPAYEHISGQRFYARALERLSTTKTGVLLGTTANDVIDIGSRVAVTTSTGEIHAKIVLDSRPLPYSPSADDPFLLQHFEGRFVQSPRPLFDPTTALLMDFDVDQSRGIHFFYVLPFDAHHALIEATWFTPEVFEPAVYSEVLEDYIERHYGHAWVTTDRIEHGVLPMTTMQLPTQVSTRVYRLGIASGAAKPSTGYAFDAIQSFSKSFAMSLATEELPTPPAYRTARQIWMDRVFLQFLLAQPKAAAGAFVKMFAAADPNALVRFLNDKGTIGDALSVMRTLPMGTFSRLAMQSFFSSRR